MATIIGQNFSKLTLLHSFFLGQDYANPKPKVLHVHCIPVSPSFQLCFEKETKKAKLRNKIFV